jgi:ABC-type uncharacterized transport system fused permease/ATPase subunit
MVLVLIAFTLVEIWSGLIIAEQAKNMQNSLKDSNQEAFWDAIKVLVSVSLAIWALTFVHIYLAGTLTLEWRRSLTDKLFAKYINSKQAFYRLKMQDMGVDNPDQRIGQDVNQFTQVTVLLVEHVARDFGTIVTNTVAVYQISPKTCWVMLTFAALYALIMLKGFVAPLMRVQRRLLGLEADLRYVLVRLRENAESIAFFQGSGVERELSEHFFLRAYRASYVKLLIEAGYRSFQSFVDHASMFLTYIPLAPMYFSGAVSFGSMTQVYMLAMQLEKSMFDLSREMDHIANLGAQGIRIRELWEALDGYNKPDRSPCKQEDGDISTDAGSEGEVDVEIARDYVSDDDEDEQVGTVHVLDLPDFGEERLIVSNLTLLPPTGKIPLLNELSFTMCSEDSVLITGASGTGKSSLLRTIGGLFARGSGRIDRTSLQRSFFVPQTPYLYEGSLRDNVMYPLSTTELSDVERVQQDSKIASVLGNLGIGYLIDRYGLDVGVEFDNILSGGEKQRLNFARVLVRSADGLSFVLLDEATSALDEANEDIAYGMLRQSVRCYISVGHRMNLKKFHTKQLMLESAPGGGCSASLAQL